MYPRRPTARADRIRYDRRPSSGRRSPYPRSRSATANRRRCAGRCRSVQAALFVAQPVADRGRLVPRTRQLMPCRHRADQTEEVPFPPSNRAAAIPKVVRPPRCDFARAPTRRRGPADQAPDRSGLRRSARRPAPRSHVQPDCPPAAQRHRIGHSTRAERPLPRAHGWGCSDGHFLAAERKVLALSARTVVAR